MRRHGLVCGMRLDCLMERACSQRECIAEHPGLTRQGEKQSASPSIGSLGSLSVCVRVGVGVGIGVGIGVGCIRMRTRRT